MRELFYARPTDSFLSSLKFEGISYSETLVPFYNTIPCYLPEVRGLNKLTSLVIGSF